MAGSPMAPLSLPKGLSLDNESAFAFAFGKASNTRGRASLAKIQIPHMHGLRRTSEGDAHYTAQKN